MHRTKIMQQFLHAKGVLRFCLQRKQNYCKCGKSNGAVSCFKQTSSVLNSITEL